MIEFLGMGGWMMIPIILCSIIGTAIVSERFWTLREEKVAPRNLLKDIQLVTRENLIDDEFLGKIGASSPLGTILASGIAHANRPREEIKEIIEEVGRHIAFDLARYLNVLGTIAAVTPLLGLLGTVFGMIEVFTAITISGVGQAGELAGGISQALVSTAAGLAVAIPALMFHRFFLGRVENLVIAMEQEAMKLLEHLKKE